MPQQVRLGDKWIGNPSMIRTAKMAQQVWFSNQASRFFSFHSFDPVFKQYKFVANGNDQMSGDGAVVMYTRELDEGGNHILVPMEERLPENPIYGDNQLKGQEVAPANLWKQVRVSMVRQARNVFSGMQAAQFSRPLMQRKIENAKPSLANFFARWVNHHGLYRAILEGTSSNNLAEYADMSTISHPNFYHWHTSTKLTRVGYGSGLPGTSAYEEAISDALDNLDGTAPFALTHDFVLRLRVAIQENRIEPMITKDGFSFWAVMIHPQIARQFRALDVFRTYRAQAETRSKSHSLFTGAILEYEGMIFFEDPEMWSVNRVTPGSAWNATTNPLQYGVALPTQNLDDYTVAGREKKLGIVLGREAIAGAKPVGLFYEDEYNDYKNTKDLAGGMICGFQRTDVFDDDETGTKYAMGGFKENTGSLVFACDTRSA